MRGGGGLLVDLLASTWRCEGVLQGLFSVAVCRFLLCDGEVPKEKPWKRTGQPGEDWLQRGELSGEMQYIDFLLISLFPLWPLFSP